MPPPRGEARKVVKSRGFIRTLELSSLLALWSTGVLKCGPVTTFHLPEGGVEGGQIQGVFANRRTVVTFSLLVLQSVELSPLSTSQREGAEGGQIQRVCPNHGNVITFSSLMLQSVELSQLSTSQRGGAESVKSRKSIRTLWCCNV